jgi:hypothetical protein
METGTKAIFEHLKNNWFSAFIAAVQGGSPEAYVAGLYPGLPNNYATQVQSLYLTGVRYRLGNIIDDFLLIVEDDIKILSEQSSTPIMSGDPLDDTCLLDQNRSTITHSMNERRWLDFAPRYERDRQNGIQERRSGLEQNRN